MFDLDKARAILDAAGTRTRTATASVRCPAAATTITLDYVVRSESQSAPGDAEFVSGWLKEIGIGTKLRTVNDATLTEIIGKGDYDLFEWGWTPFVDPDPSSPTSRAASCRKDPDDPTNYYNDASWCDPSYDADYKAQNQELDHAKRARDRASHAADDVRRRGLQRPAVRA